MPIGKCYRGAGISDTVSNQFAYLMTVNDLSYLEEYHVVVKRINVQPMIPFPAAVVFCNIICTELVQNFVEIEALKISHSPNDQTAVCQTYKLHKLSLPRSLHNPEFFPRGSP